MRRIPIIMAMLFASTVAGCQTSCSSSTAETGTSVSSSSAPKRSKATQSSSRRGEGSFRQ